MGSMLHNAGNREVARAFYTKAVVHHPEDPMGHLNLGNALVEDGEDDAALAHYNEALRLNPGSANAHFSLSLLYRKLGDEDAALRHHQLAFARPWVRTELFRGSGTPVQLLVIVSATGGNLVTTMLLDDRLMQVYMINAEGYRADDDPSRRSTSSSTAIGDADRSTPAPRDRRADRRNAARSPSSTTRRASSPRDAPASPELLGALPGVATPRTELLASADVTADALLARGFRFPLLVALAGLPSHRPPLRVRRAAWRRSRRSPPRLPGDELLRGDRDFSTFAERTGRSMQVPRAHRRRRALSAAPRDRSSSRRSTTSQPTCATGPTIAPEEATYLEAICAQASRCCGRYTTRSMRSGARWDFRLRRDRLCTRPRRQRRALSKPTRRWRSTIPTTTNATPIAAQRIDRVLAAFRAFVVALAGRLCGGNQRRLLQAAADRSDHPLAQPGRCTRIRRGRRYRRPSPHWTEADVGEAANGYPRSACTLRSMNTGLNTLYVMLMLVLRTQYPTSVPEASSSASVKLPFTVRVEVRASVPGECGD